MATQRDGSGDGVTVGTAIKSSEIEEWQLWCRLCAKEDAQGNISVLLKDEQQNVGDLSLVNAIAKYFWVNIEKDERLPKMLCTECFSLVTSLVNFGERVSKVQQMFQTLQNRTAIITRFELHEVRLKYGLLDEDREHVLMQQALPEVHYFEAKPKINELEENVFENEAATTENPLEQPRIKIKIKKENIVEDHTEKKQRKRKCLSKRKKLKLKNRKNKRTNGFDGVEFQTTIDGDDESEGVFEDSGDEYQPVETNKQEEETSSDQQDSVNEAEKNEIKCELYEMENIEQPAKKRRRITRRRKESTEHESGEVKAIDSNAAAGDSDGDGDGDADVEEEEACTECPRKFKRLQHLNQHMRRLHSKALSLPEVKCPECSRFFATQDLLNRHAKTHLPLQMRKTLPCPYCDKMYSSNSLVQMHIRYMHMNERQVICEECGAAVRTISALKEHMLTHTDYAPFLCEVCKKGFKNSSRLRKHMEIHDPNKHICAECGLQLNSRATLNRHLLVHSDKMQHKCDYCNREFKRAKSLKNHLILHTGLKPYSCDFCDRTFANGSNCRTHKKKSHPEELAAQEAAGQNKPYTKNIPKLEALKAVTKVADNLAPVVSKQSGRFSYGKKPPALEKEASGEKANKTKNNHNNNNSNSNADISCNKSNSTASAANNASNVSDLAMNVMHPAVPEVALEDTSTHTITTSAIPTIDNIYSHIMKQASLAAQNASALELHLSTTTTTTTPPAEALQIKRPPSQASLSCVSLEHDATSTDVPQLQLQHQHMQPGGTAVTRAAPNFYTQIAKQTSLNLTAHGQHLSAIRQQQQQQHALHQEEIVSIRSPDSQASHLTDEHSNASTQFFNHIRQNIHGGAYM